MRYKKGLSKREQSKLLESIMRVSGIRESLEASKAKGTLTPAAAKDLENIEMAWGFLARVFFKYNPIEKEVANDG